MGQPRSDEAPAASGAPSVRAADGAPSVRAADGAPSGRTRVKRGPHRAVYEPAAIRAILDEGFLAHVGFARDGTPSVIPCVYARWGNDVYLHGSTGNRMLRAIAAGEEVCISVTLLDGIVLARSAFHTSVNYRSVVLYGRGAEVVDPDEKHEALRRTVEHAVPGRWGDVRRPNDEEVARTLVVRVPIDEASAKCRAGDPVDDEPDHALDCWAGQIPLRLVAGVPVDDALLRDGIPAPGYARSWTRPGAGR